MITPSAMRIVSQDFPDDVRAWIHRLILPINQFMTSVHAVLNKGITFKDHMNSELKTIRLSSNDPLMISHKLKTRPIGVVVIRIDEEPKDSVFIDWTIAENGIRIRRVFGLEPKKTYTLTLLIIGG